MKRENAAVGIDKEANSDINEYLLGSIDLSVLNDDDIWIADTAATVHMTPHRERLESIRNITAKTITMGNGTTEEVTESGDLFGEIKSKGKTIPIRIQDVTIMPNGTFNLFSVSQALWEMEGNKNEITLKKGKCELKFDLKISTSKGVLYATKIARRSEICGTIGDLATAKMTANQAHQILGHMSNEQTKQVAMQLGWKLTEAFETCEACAVGKACQKNIATPAKSITRSDKTGRVHIDISSVQNTEFPELESSYKPYWLIIVDELTQYKTSGSFRHKSSIIEPTCQKLWEWIQSGKYVKIIRCEDAGENHALEKKLKGPNWKLDIAFEYTGRDTPQRNSLAEVAFHTIASRGRAIMNDAKVPTKFPYLLWREAFRTATMLDNFTIIELNGIRDTRYVHWNGMNPKFTHNMRT